MVLYIANKNYSSWSLRPWILLRELGIPFEERLAPFHARPFGGFSPSGKVPCLHDGDVVVWDSLAITEYIAESHPRTWPADRGARAWARSAAAEMHSGFTTLRQRCSMSVGVRIRLERDDALDRDLARLEALWADGLGRFGGPFLAGPTFTAVDAFFTPVAFRYQTYGLPASPVAASYLERLRALPGMRAWERDALAEPFRDPDHDNELEGVVVEDLRTA